MTLDEAIKHCEEIADNFERTLARFDGDNVQKENTCACMNDHRQLANWLKELKAYKEGPQGDLISREALRKSLEELKKSPWYCEHRDTIDGIASRQAQKETLQIVENIIDNAPTVPLPDFKEGYKQAIIDGKTNFSRPQGEYVDISKLRLMTVEECAGHTIDYAMGWKACIEWIKKGGAK